MRPFTLPPNVLRHFYAGGARIAALRGIELDSDHMPEEWLGAANTTFGGYERGLSRLPDGTFVRDAIAADPEAYLGAEHAAALRRRSGAAGQAARRRPAPARALPSRPRVRPRGARPRTARPRRGCIVEADPRRRGSRRFRARRRARRGARAGCATQDSGAMLDAMHELAVAAGDVVFVPAGTPHAIGAGILMVELQEPTDLSVLLEWDGFELDEDDGHLNLGWDRALQALDRRGWDAGPGARAARARAARRRRPVLPRRAPAPRRRARPGLLDPRRARRQGHARHRGGRARAQRGAAVLLPHAAGAGELRGNLELLRARPPDAGAGEGEW